MPSIREESKKNSRKIVKIVRERGGSCSLFRDTHRCFHRGVQICSDSLKSSVLPSPTL